MKYRVLFSEAAETDIAELLDYLVPRAGDSIARAYADRLIDYCIGFATFPERGMLHEDVSPGLRTVGYNRQATIAFRVKDRIVTILRIYHGGRDIDWAHFE